MKKTKENLNLIVEKLPDNENIAKEILKKINNTTTKVELDNQINSSYYVYLNDTIYLSNKDNNKRNYYRVCMISHECKHSVQSKWIQKLNFINSNVELIIFFISLILIVLKIELLIITVMYFTCLFISIIPRIILEVDAIVSSIDISSNYLCNYLNEKDKQTLLSAYKKQIILFFPLFILSMFSGRIFRGLTILYIYILKSS